MQPTSGLGLKGLPWCIRLIVGGHRIYQRVMPEHLRRKLRLGERLVKLKQTVLLLWNRDGKQPQSNFVIQQVKGENAEQEDCCSLDFIGATAHYQSKAEAVLRELAKLDNNSLLVAVMEEAAVVAWLSQAGQRIPYLISLHIFESLYMPIIYGKAARVRVERYLLAAACNAAHAVTFPSEGCLEDLKRNFDVQGNNIVKLWNPIDCADVRRLSFETDTDANAWHNRNDGYRLVHVGRLDPQKNHDLLLDVCVELKRRGRRFSLSIVGDGHDRERIENRINSLGLSSEVALVGERRNPYPWMKAADALLLTSRFEAFALVLVEAMACGTPVVAVDCPSGPAEVLGNGKYGVLVPNDESLAFADAVERLMTDVKYSRQLVDLGYERIQCFDIKKVISQWQSLIDSVPAAADN